VCNQSISVPNVFIQTFSAQTFTKWCCDRHPGSGFHIRRHFQGRFLYQDNTTLKLFYGDVDEPDREEILLPAKEKRRSKKKVRPGKEREILKLRLLSWRTETHKHDPLAAVRPPTFILDDKGIKILATIHPTDIRNTTQVVLALDETEEWDQEWSKEIITIIQAYDNELKDTRKTATAQQKARQKRQADTERRIRESVLQQASRFSNTNVRSLRIQK
jgi:hypothetical protein